MTPSDDPARETAPAQPADLAAGPPSMAAQIYDALRVRLITGRIMPGVPFSTRGLARELEVSQTPVRDALARLAAEGAVEIRSKRRITVPEMTRTRYDDLMRCRLLLEPAAAAHALPLIGPATVKRLVAIDADIDTALANGNVEAYMRDNFRFHFLIYRAAAQPITLRLIETLWAQFGPFMRVIYGFSGTAQLLDRHQEAITAIRAADAGALHRAILEDINDGMRLIEQGALSTRLSI